MMIRCTVRGDFKRTTSFLKRIQKLDLESLLRKYAEEGVEALSSATPKRTGKTAASWSYDIVKKKDRITIYWTNDNMSDGVPIAVIIEYGHATQSGAYVSGRHYISPAIRPTFDKIAEAAWKEVTK